MAYKHTQKAFIIDLVLQTSIVVVGVLSIAVTTYILLKSVNVRPRSSGVSFDLEQWKQFFSSKSKEEMCAHVITPARHVARGECHEFPGPCDVPPGWKVDETCRGIRLTD